MISQRIAVTVLAVGLVLGLTQGASAQLGGGFRAPDPNEIASIGNDSVIAVETPEKDGLKVYSIDDGTWSVYRAPKGTRVRPMIVSGNYVATVPEGSKISQLAVYNVSTNTWITQDLKETFDSQTMWGPVVSPGMVVYRAGHHVYAYSALASKWAVLDLPEGPEESQMQPILGQRVATLTHGNHLYIFNAKFARWDDSGDRPK